MDTFLELLKQFNNIQKKQYCIRIDSDGFYSVIFIKGDVVIDEYLLEVGLEKSTIRLAKMVQDYEKASKLANSGALKAIYGDDDNG